MRTQWLTRNADIGTIETRDELDDLGSEAPGAGGFLVPTWATHITRIAAAGAIDGAAIGSGLVIGYLEGALDNGDASLPFLISGGGVQVATGTLNAMGVYMSPPLAVPVVAGARMKAFAEVYGDAENDSEVSISIQFSDAPEPGGCHWSRAYTADVDAVDTDTGLTGAFGSNTAPENQVPKKSTELAWVSGAFASDQATDGTAAMMVHIKAGPILDEQHITIGASGGIAGQAGSDETAILVPAQNIPCISPTVPGSDISGKVRGEQMGDDFGSGQIGAVLWFR